MKIKTVILLLSVLLFPVTTTCQFKNIFKKPTIAEEYSRNSISFLLLNFEDDNHFKELKNGVLDGIVPAKFDHNNLKKVTLKAPFDHSYLNEIRLRQKLRLSNSSCIGSFLFCAVPIGTELIEGKPPLKQILAQNAQYLKKSITEIHYANEVVKYWWGVDEGTYSPALIQKRGFYNATDRDVNIADAEKIGRAVLADEGEKLIKNSYIMLLDFYHVKSKAEIYDLREKKKGKKVKRKRKGFKGNLNAYLFKINYNDTVKGYFNECFLENNKVNVSKLENIFDHVYSPVEYVISESVRANATVSKAREIKKNLTKKDKQELAADFVNKGIFKVLNKVEKEIEDFRVKTPVTQTHPIGAKIGKKEGLTRERRYFAWKYVENKSGKIKPRKVGVVRTGKVVDNRRDKLGQTQTSTFYQIGGSKIDNGMILQERKDIGIGVTGGYSTLGGPVFAGDINTGQFFKLPFKQLKLYLEIVTGSTDYQNIAPIEGLTATSTMPESGTYYENKMSFGFLKEFPFARNFHAGCYLGYTTETVTWSDKTNDGIERDGESLSSGGLHWAVKFGFNLLSHNIHLSGSFGGYHYGEVSYSSGIMITETDGSIEKEVEEEAIFLGKNWNDIFPDKKTFGFNIALRITF